MDSKIYLDFLKNDLKKRQTKNRSYSLRAYSKLLGISHGSLSMVLAGKRGISPAMIHKISEKLDISFQEKELFRQSALSHFARAKKEKLKAHTKVKNLVQDSNVKILQCEQLAAINHWLHIAIFEIISSTSHVTLETLVDYFPKHQQKLPSILEALETIEVIRKCGLEYHPVVQGVQTFNDIPSKSIREFHSSVIDQAGKAIHDQDVKLREFQNTVLMFPLEKMFEAKNLIRQFVLNFNQFAYENININDLKLNQNSKIYSLSINFFRLE